jgi:hypothetical protein
VIILSLQRHRTRAPHSNHMVPDQLPNDQKPRTGRPDAWIRARPDHRCAAERVSGASYFRQPGHLSVPSRGSGDSPSATWCRISFPMLESPRTGRPDTWRGFDACSPGSPLRGRAGERGIGFPTTGSSERPGSRLVDRATVLAPRGAGSAS